MLTPKTGAYFRADSNSTTKFSMFLEIDSNQGNISRFLEVDFKRCGNVQRFHRLITEEVTIFKIFHNWLRTLGKFSRFLKPNFKTDATFANLQHRDLKS